MHRHCGRLPAVVLAFLALLALCACAAQAVPAGAQSAQAPSGTEPPQDLLSGLTLEQKVGQLFVVRPDALDPDQTAQQRDDADADGVTALSDEMRQALARYPVGGIVVFGKNLESPGQLTALLADFQAASAVPLFAAVDEEGGSVARLANADGFSLPQYESAAAVGASGDPQDAREMCRTIGTYLKEYGFNLDFAPVADVSTNPDNPVIGARAFSSDPQTAALLVGGACSGFAEAGIACTLKHFPGHGDTAQDTHTGAVALNKTLEELLACELVPFAQNVSQAQLVMAAHISAPLVTGDDTPASLSRTMLTDILRGELHYQGLIITDSLSMKAITDRCTAGQAAVQALCAGADLLLMPADLPQAYDAVLAAVQDGTLPQARLDESVRRILQCKQALGLSAAAQ